MSCDREAIDEQDGVNNTEKLNATGEAFMSVIKTRPEWETEWQKVIGIGTPLPNEAVVAYGSEYGLHYVIPVVSGKEIVSLVFIPLSIEEENGSCCLRAKSQEILLKEDIGKSVTALSFTRTKEFRKFKEKGFIISVNFDIKGSDIVQKMVKTRSYNERYWVGSEAYYTMYGTNQQIISTMAWVDRTYDEVFLIYQLRHPDYTLVTDQSVTPTTISMEDVDNITFWGIINDFWRDVHDRVTSNLVVTSMTVIHILWYAPLTGYGEYTGGDGDDDGGDDGNNEEAELSLNVLK